MENLLRVIIGYSLLLEYKVKGFLKLVRWSGVVIYPSGYCNARPSQGLGFDP
jgi:hypothetical protein